MPEQWCPNCGRSVNRVSGDIEPPSEGDVTVCVRCAAALEIGPGRLLIKLDLSKIDPLLARDIRRVQSMVKQIASSKAAE